MQTQVKTEQDKKLKGTDIQKITPFLWFDKQAEEAARFYTSTFNNSRIETTTRYNKDSAQASGMKEGTVMTIVFKLEGQEFTAINGGPVFTITPTISFFVNCNTAQEVDRLWGKLSPGGKVFMELKKYPFSEKYGWIEDKFGVSWQLILQERPQKISPCLMFTGEQHLKAEDAISYYISIFRNSGIEQLERYKSGEGPEGAIVHSRFKLNGQEFIAMDSHEQMPYDFSPALSLVVNCDTQDEIDYYWDNLSKGGFEGAQQCGWLQDKFGVSWQIFPTELGRMLTDPDQKKSARATQAMLKMKKLDINVLRKAFDQR